MQRKEYNKFMQDRMEYFYSVKFERQHKIDEIPRAIANKELKKQL